MSYAYDEDLGQGECYDCGCQLGGGESLCGRCESRRIDEQESANFRNERDIAKRENANFKTERDNLFRQVASLKIERDGMVQQVKELTEQLAKLNANQK